mgnify:CR=1 FL=1
MPVYEGKEEYYEKHNCEKRFHQAAHRSLFYAMGYTEEELKKP